MRARASSLIGRRGGPVALLVALVLIWAASWPIIRVAVQDVPPVWLGVLRYAIATAIVLPAVFLTGGWRLPPRQDWSLIIVSGTLQMGAYGALMAYALTTLPPGRASVIAYSTPLWVVPLAAVWLGERTSVRAGSGVLLGMAGLLCIAAPSMTANDGAAISAYIALAAASLAWAITIVFVRGHRFTASPFQLAPWQMLTAAVILLPAAIGLEGAPPPFSDKALWALAFVGPVSTAFAYWATVEAGRHFRASTISMSLLATPCLGILISAWFLGEHVDGSLSAGLLLVVLGIAMALSASVPPPAVKDAKAR